RMCQLDRGPDLPHVGTILHDVMLDDYFTAALFETGSSIVQRRTGKNKSFDSKRKADVDLGCNLRPQELLDTGKEIARSLATGLDDEARLSMARSFCTVAANAFWSSIQAGERAVLPLPE